MLFFAIPATGFCAGVIGQDDSITFPVATILTSPDPSYDVYVQVYNYFFTLILSNGLVAAFIFNVIRIFK